MNRPTYSIRAKVWLYPGHDAKWHFVTVSKKVSKEIKDLRKGPRRGFGSVPVKVELGDSTWNTSIFPSKEGEYLLPLKAKVRKDEGIEVGKMISFKITLR